MRVTRKGWAVPAGLVGAGVMVAWLGRQIGVAARREDQIIISVGILGVLLLSYPKLWALRRFWVLVVAWFAGHALLLWILFDLWFPQAERIGFWMTVIAAAEVICLQYLLNRCRIRLIENHRREPGNRQDVT
jgi:hypothetical protein